MENLLVWLIVAGALVFVIKGFIKTYKGEGKCGCAGNCSGCSGTPPQGPCEPGNSFLHK